MKAIAREIACQIICLICMMPVIAAILVQIGY